MLEFIGKVITDAVRTILFMLDQVVYFLVPTVYKLIISLANVDLYNGNSAITALLNRVYIIVGVFMLFKLAFAMLRYIVDPGSFSDQSKGFAGLVKRVLIAVILLVSVPFLFSKIYDYQGIILRTGVISNLILGTDNHNVSDMNEAAVDLQFMMFGPFFSLNAKDSNELAACAVSDSGDKPLSNIIGSTDMVTKDGCLEAVAAAMNDDSTVKSSGSTINKFFKQSSGDERDFSALGGLVTWTLDSGEYAVNYLPIISTICGGYLVFLLLSFCIDIASRAIRLMFLQILSPVAIISSVDPTSSSQNDKLKDWGMECLKTYISLFLRLIVIYTVIQMIYVISAKVFVPDSLYNSGFQPDSSLNIWIYIFLILGAFSVAKKIPELIEKAFGAKFSGEISMNPFKGFKENIGASLIGAGAAAIGGGLVNAGVSGIQAGTQAFNSSMAAGNGGIRSAFSAIGHGFGRGVTSGVAGAASTLNRGVRGVMHGERGFKNMKNAYGSAMFARQQREDLKRQGVRQSDILKSDVLRNLGMFTPAQKEQMRISGLEHSVEAEEKAFQREKTEYERQLAETTRPIDTYKSYLQQIEQRINHDSAVDAAIKKLDTAKAVGDKSAIDAAIGDLKQAKQKAFVSYMGTQSGRAMQSKIDNLRSNYELLQDKKFDYFTQDSKTGLAGFNGDSMKYLDDAKYDIESTLSNSERFRMMEEDIAQRKDEIEIAKSDPKFQRDQLADKQQRVNSPQPDGWNPTWGYGPEGPGAMFGRNGGFPPPPPGSYGGRPGGPGPGSGPGPGGTP